MALQDEKYSGLRELPPFPAIATKLLRALSHDNAEFKEIVTLIRADAALSSELLQIVNSPVYGFPSRISSIQNAVTLLGLNRVKCFAVAVSMKGFLHTALRLDLLRLVWRHSLACGLVCEELSAACSSSPSGDDRAYTAGLLHNLGRLGLFVAHPESYTELLTDKETADILAREREAFGVDHCEAGGWLAETWGLPDEIRLAAIGHHQPPRGKGFDLLDLVRVGVLLTEMFGFDVTPPPHAYTMVEIRSLLPEAAQYRFDPDPDAMRARIIERLDTFD